MIAGVLAELLGIAREALESRGDAQRIAELENQAISLQRRVNELSDYKARREVQDEALLLLRKETDK